MLPYLNEMMAMMKDHKCLHTGVAKAPLCNVVAALTYLAK